MKKTFLLFLTLTLILGVFVSCDRSQKQDTTETTSVETSSETTIETITETTAETTVETTVETTTETTEETTTEEIKYVTDYEVKKVGDQWYMIFDSYIPNPEVHEYQYSSVFSSSIGQLRDDIINHNLTSSQMNTIVDNFTRDNIGIPIFNIDEVYVSNVSGDDIADDSGDTGKRFSWIDGETYVSIQHQSITSKFDTSIKFVFTNKTHFEKEYNKISVQNDVSKRTIQSDDKTADIFTINSDSYYDNEYLLTMFITEGEYHYYYVISGINDAPSDDVLLSYGMEKLQEQYKS